MLAPHAFPLATLPRTLNKIRVLYNTITTSPQHIAHIAPLLGYKNVSTGNVRTVLTAGQRYGMIEHSVKTAHYNITTLGEKLITELPNATDYFSSLYFCSIFSLIRNELGEILVEQPVLVKFLMENQKMNSQTAYKAARIYLDSLTYIFRRIPALYHRKIQTYEFGQFSTTIIYPSEINRTELEKILKHFLLNIRE